MGSLQAGLNISHHACGDPSIFFQVSLVILSLSTYPGTVPTQYPIRTTQWQPNHISSAVKTASPLGPPPIEAAVTVAAGERNSRRVPSL